MTKRIRRFSLLEIIFTCIILIIALTGIYSNLHMSLKFRIAEQRKMQALLVLDNSIERISAIPTANRTKEKARIIFEDEYNLSELANHDGISNNFQTIDNGLSFTIYQNNKRILATTTIGYASNE